MKRNFKANVVKRRFSLVVRNASSSDLETKEVFAESAEAAILQIPLEWDVITCTEVTEGGPKHHGT